MLKIFKSDINQTELNALLRRIKNEIFSKLTSNVPVKNFFISFFRLEEMQIESFIGEVIGEINDDEEIFLTNNENIKIFDIYHELYKIIDELSNLKNLRSKQNIRRKEYNKGISCLLSFNNLIDELHINGINLPLEKIDNLSREELDLKRITRNRKEDRFCEIDNIYTHLSELHNILRQLNEIFSYNINISPIRNRLALHIKINSCPYCNLHILDLTNVDLGDNEVQISAYCELDHILPQSKYPLFASSIWNLVPVCHDCNSKKSDNLISFNSWKLDLNNEDFEIKIVKDKTEELLSYISIGDYDDSKKIRVDIITNNNDKKRDIETLDLTERYCSRMNNEDTKQLLRLINDGLRNSTSMSISELLINTRSNNPSEVFSYYFKIEFCDYKEKHYNKVNYGKLISEFLRDHGLNENLFER